MTPRFLQRSPVLDWPLTMNASLLSSLRFMKGVHQTTVTNILCHRQVFLPKIDIDVFGETLKGLSKSHTEHTQLERRLFFLIDANRGLCFEHISAGGGVESYNL